MKNLMSSLWNNSAALRDGFAHCKYSELLKKAVALGNVLRPTNVSMCDKDTFNKAQSMAESETIQIHGNGRLL